MADMELTPKVFRDVQFREKLRGGYHPEDVDEFLEQAAVGVEEMTERLRLATEGLRVRVLRPNLNRWASRHLIDFITGVSDVSSELAPFGSDPGMDSNSFV